MSHESLQIDAERCIGCGACVEACPFGALRLESDLAVVDERCTACGACLESCPVEALSLPAVRAAEGTPQARGVWVWVEQSAGTVHSVSWEMLGQGRRLADELCVPLTACVLGHDVAHLAPAAISRGADRVLLVEHPELAHFGTLPYAAAMEQLVRRETPEILLLGATSRGRDLAGAVATALRTGLTADCTELSIDPVTRLLLQTRPAYGGNIMATITTPQHRPQMATVRHRVFAQPVPDPTRQGLILPLSVVLPPESLLTTLLSYVPAEEDVNIAEARIIVSGGAGVGGAEGFAPLRELAQVLGGAVGASRAAVDAGWIPYPHQVGQTGRTVQPELYVACGISGAVQHRAGMATSRVIVAINRDEHAPIFSIAHYGIVGDCLQIVPALTRALAARLAR
ncbi:MAG: FAD-binding protein [Anaerolineae bacterium]|jgi:electron transfer flavoprotein alpha subunit|nr:electron transfer flavoprotein subunit alpha [Chloroflexota bacterium]